MNVVQPIRGEKGTTPIGLGADSHGTERRAIVDTHRHPVGPKLAAKMAERGFYDPKQELGRRAHCGATYRRNFSSGCSRRLLCFRVKHLGSPSRSICTTNTSEQRTPSKLRLYRNRTVWEDEQHRRSQTPGHCAPVPPPKPVWPAPTRESGKPCLKELRAAPIHPADPGCRGA
jgi:hypothetical protein